MKKWLNLIPHIADCGTLHVLSFFGEATVDDESIPHLKTLSRVAYMILCSLGVSDEAAEELSIALPHCQIEWVEYVDTTQIER